MSRGAKVSNLSSFVLRLSSFVALVFSLFVVQSGCGRVAGIPSSAAGNVLTQQQRFTLKDLNDEAVSLDQVLTQNKAVLLDFWATWCGYCVQEMPALSRLYQQNKSRGFTVLAVNVGESKEQAALFAKKMNISFPIVLDEDNSVSQAYGIVGIPTSFLIDPSGKIIGEYHTYDRRLETEVEKSLAK